MSGCRSGAASSPGLLYGHVRVHSGSQLMHGANITAGIICNLGLLLGLGSPNSFLVQGSALWHSSQQQQQY